MTRLGALALTLCTTLSLTAALLVAGGPQAQAAKASYAPWKSYLWPASGTCQYDVVTPSDHFTETKELQRSGLVVSSTQGTYDERFRAKKDGSLVYTTRMRFSSSFGRYTSAFTAHYPSPSALARHKRGSATVVNKLVLTKKAAKDPSVRKLLKKGSRTLVITGRYRITGLGTRAFTVGGASVTAVGAKTELKHVKLTNVRAKRKRAYAASVRPSLAAIRSSEWWAPGVGEVSFEYAAYSSTHTLVSCS
ncbi:MAG: hypothetical protein QM572_10240 [Nocardioides sp.]|uniref:hypothetical protein n=1 Tax=Nocardioides sp. TaxID=35761 RepID=UPI0039E426B0